MTSTTVPQAPGPLGYVPPRPWYSRSVMEVARDLLGSYLTTRIGAGRVTVRITEVEAYAGADDPGSHAFRGRTARNQVMFGEPGRLYVYRHLGLHDCVNVVCEPSGTPAAVLLRAGEVVDGVELATERRTAAGVVTVDTDLARGPARLAVALGLGLADNGTEITLEAGAAVLYLREQLVAQQIMSGPRVGVWGEGGDGTSFPWRLWLSNEPTVSQYRPGYRRPRPR